MRALAWGRTQADWVSKSVPDKTGKKRKWARNDSNTESPIPWPQHHVHGTGNGRTQITEEQKTKSRISLIRTQKSHCYLQRANRTFQGSRIEFYAQRTKTFLLSPTGWDRTFQCWWAEGDFWVRSIVWCRISSTSRILQWMPVSTLRAYGRA